MKRETRKKWERACLLLACNYHEINSWCGPQVPCEVCMVRGHWASDGRVSNHGDLASLALDGCDIRELP